MSAADSTSTSARPRRDTPAMRQYDRFKKQHPDCVLFFRMGDFYEMFDDDAVLAHQVLGITLTQRTEGIPMAGVPYHSVEGYLRRMIEAGHRVAVCEQVQDAKDAKGVVDRAVTRVVTPGTLVDESLLDESAANTIAAIQFLDLGDDARAVVALAELSTGALTLHHVDNGNAADEVARLRPAELLYVETADGNVPRRVEHVAHAAGCALTARPGWTFRPDEAREMIFDHYRVQTVTGFGLDEDEPALGPAGALLRYLNETQTGTNGASLAHLRPPAMQRNGTFVTIDAVSLRSLEIEKTLRTGRVDGSLLAVLQHCRTPMGKRLLREWLCFPSRDRDTIIARQQCVSALLHERAFFDNLCEHLSCVQDVSRIVGRIALHRASPRDLVALGRSVDAIAVVADLLADRKPFARLRDELAGLAESIAPLAETIISRCVEDPPAHLREGGMFRDGVDAQLDEARGLQRDANTWLAAYQKQLTEQTGIANLKVGYNKVFGYYIELSRANADKAPDSFTRKQTLKNAERYITPELKEFEDKVTTAEARAIEREQHLFSKLSEQAGRHAAELSRYAQVVAELDVLANFADVAGRFNYTRPEIVDEPVIDIHQGRHPVLDRTLVDRFVPNNCQLGRAADGEEAKEQSTEDKEATLALITGPNMAGKSTYIRQVALITLLAHTGSFVPAESATIGIVDRIFTRVGASDELHLGQSTFMVEMTETANILNHATDRSLVILDEIGRGTSTLDGLSLAWAIAETLAARGPLTLFATHYHELTTLAERLPQVRNWHVAVREWGDEIVFLYAIAPGRADRSYGIHVAKIAGVPRDTIARAQQLLESLAVHHESPDIPERSAAAAGKPEPQMQLFTEYIDHPVIVELGEMDLNALSPIEAFDRLRQLIEKARR